MTAIIPAAGKGTRFQPITRVIPKEMLPIGAKPAIHCIVEEAISAGADDVVVVISPEKELIRRYFEGDPELSRKVRFAYQKEQRGLGHAVLQAAGKAEGPVLILLGDALVSGPNPSAEMVAVSKANGGVSVIGMETVAKEKVSRYGIAALEGPVPNAGESVKIADLVEKPSIEQAPSNLAVAGRYLLDGEIFNLLETQQPGHGGEIQLTDAIRRLLAVKSVFGYVYPGKRQDIGNPAGYLAALEAFYGNNQG
ncbi:MAG: NTP transferase domain-containing protein [Kiritimatiellae bacterium]|nr:NTP transferase domain-containing protein [Kiritimatiellia bacterium]